MSLIAENGNKELIGYTLGKAEEIVPRFPSVPMSSFADMSSDGKQKNGFGFQQSVKKHYDPKYCGMLVDKIIVVIYHFKHSIFRPCHFPGCFQGVSTLWNCKGVNESFTRRNGETLFDRHSKSSLPRWKSCRNKGNAFYIMYILLYALSLLHIIITFLSLPAIFR